MLDLMHLVIVVAGVAIGAWALVALRRSLPRGRFVIFSIASAGALFGCAALGGEVGLLPRQAWFAIVMGLMGAIAIAGHRAGRTSPVWR
jgi:hypothetical protein